MEYFQLSFTDAAAGICVIITDEANMFFGF
jgi:hypothetical protein